MRTGGSSFRWLGVMVGVFFNWEGGGTPRGSRLNETHPWGNQGSWFFGSRREFEASLTTSAVAKNAG